MEHSKCAIIQGDSMKYWITLLILVPAIGWADLVEDIRKNDARFMTMVERQDVQAIKVVDFVGPDPWAIEKDGFQWGGILVGMETKCLETERNPCGGFDPECKKPIGRIFDNPKPSIPLTAVPTPSGGTTLLYTSNFGSPLLDGAKPRFNFSRFGCDDLGQSDWGDGPWSIVFPEEYTAVCLGVRFNQTNLLRRQHFNFWRDNAMVGHRDLVGEPGPPSDRDLCWVSTVPFNAITSWQDGPGIFYIYVVVGEPATTECERATRTADDAADDAVQACQ